MFFSRISWLKFKRGFFHARFAHTLFSHGLAHHTLTLAGATVKMGNVLSMFSGNVTPPLPPEGYPEIPYCEFDPFEDSDDYDFDPFALQRKATELHGPVFWYTRKSRMFSGLFLFVADAELLQEMWKKGDELFAKVHMKHSTLRKMSKSSAMFVSDDDEEHWGMSHRIFMPAFSDKGMKNYFDIVQEVVGELVQKFTDIAEKGEPLDISKYASKFTFEVICRVGFNKSYNSILGEVSLFVPKKR